MHQEWQYNTSLHQLWMIDDFPVLPELRNFFFLLKLQTFTMFRSYGCWKICRTAWQETWNSIIAKDWHFTRGFLKGCVWTWWHRVHPQDVFIAEMFSQTKVLVWISTKCSAVIHLDLTSGSTGSLNTVT